jgi:hypothetical protein
MLSSLTALQRIAVRVVESLTVDLNDGCLRIDKRILVD